MSRHSVHVLGLCMIAILGINGCLKPSPPAAVKITVEYPGASPKIVDDLVCLPIRIRLLGIDGLSTMTCISSHGLAEIYVQGESGLDIAALSKKVDARTQSASSELPSLATIKSVINVSGQTIPPKLDVHDVASPCVTINRDKVARLGIRISDISRAVDTCTKAGKKLSEVTVQSSSGASIPLTDFATIETVYEPNYIIVRWPEQ